MRVLLKLILILAFILPINALQADSIITNTAYANFSIDGVSQSISSNIQFTTETVVEATDTIVLKKVSNVSSALTGSDIIYTLTVTNPNANQLDNVYIEDTLPTGLSYVTDSAELDAVALDSTDVSYIDSDLSLNIGNIPANSSVDVNYTVSVSATAPLGDASNRATVFSDTATSPQASANVVISHIYSPLELVKVSDKDNILIGDTTKYTLSITNNNNRIITDAIVSDVMPSGLDYVIGSALLNGNSITADTSAGLTFNIGDMTTGSTSVLSYDALVNNSNDDKIIINNATVVANELDTDSNTASASINVVNDELLITKSTTSTGAYADDTVDYTVTLTNPLTREISNVIIKDTLPMGFIYETGSALLNNVAIPASDILISDDDESENSVKFTFESIAASTSIILSYKVTVSGTATPGDNVNTAQATSDFAASTTATATVRVRTPSTISFLKISTTGTTSVIQPTSYNTNTEGGKNFEKISSIPLPNGSTIDLPTPQPIIFANQYTQSEPIVIEVTDLDQNLDPLVLETIEITVSIPGTNDTEILLLTETSVNSGIFRGVVLTTTETTQVQDGTLTIVDGVEILVDYKDDDDLTDTSVTAALIVPDTTLLIEKSADKESSAVGELVRYTLNITNDTGYDLNELQVADLLPSGFVYMPDSAKLNDELITDSVNTNGRSLIFDLSDMSSGDSWSIEYVTKVSAGAAVGNAINTAYFSSGSLRSNDAQATVKITDDLMRSMNLLTGRVYIGCKTYGGKDNVLANAKIIMETGRSVQTDKEGFWHMEGVYPGAHVLQLDTESIAGYEPLLCNDNTRRASDPKSHFVDLKAGNLWHVDFHVQAIAGFVKDQTTNLKLNEAIDPSITFSKEYVETANEDFEILWPKNNFVPAIASTKIFIKSHPKYKVEVLLNGNKVSALNYDGSDTNKTGTAVVRRWVGVDINIKNRDNSLVAILKNKAGKEIARKSHNIHFSSSPASAEIIEEQSVLTADGKTSPVITIKIKDEDGFPMRANTHGYFSVMNNKYTVKASEDNDEGESTSGSYKYQIGEGGIAKIRLNPTTQSGQVKLKLKFDEKDVEVSAWLKPALREWVMVGIAEGTLAHNRLSGTMKALEDLDQADGFSESGRIAFYAKGQVKGKYLLTMAYDTHKQDRELGTQLNGGIDPDAYYTVYADKSTNQYNAPSSEKLYVKVEKDNFYALFGDYQSSMTVTDLASYSRTLNGIKTEYHGDRLSFKGFLSETSNNYQYEEIPGDGTSGLYQLSNNIVLNSETITIETRDRYDSNEVISSTEMTRYEDYNIDYDEGTLFFTSPISSHDSDYNTNVIVIDYDSETDSNKSIVVGGRAVLKLLKGKLEQGLSFINEGQNNKSDNQLIGADLSYQITDDTKVKAEIAQSRTEESNYEKRNAYIMELKQEINNIETRLYYKKQDSNFGISSQVSSSGSEKAGAELNYKINDKTRISSELSKQKDLESDDKVSLAKVSLDHKYKQYNFNVGISHTEEDTIDDDSVETQTKSDALLLGGSYTTKNNKVTLRSNIEKNITSDSSDISPDRLVLGIDVKVSKDFTVFAENTTSDDGDDDLTNSTRIGLSRKLWKGARTQTSYTQEQSDEGKNNYATIGLSQTVNLSQKIKADFNIDKAKTLESSGTDDSDTSSDYTSFSVGLASKDKNWDWNSRAEYKDSNASDKVSFSASATRHYENGKALNAKFSYYNDADENGDIDRDVTLSFGSAWHPKEKDFVFFNRLDLVSSKSTTVTESDDADTLDSIDETDTQKIIHNMHYNQKINNRTRVGFHHGIKYVRDVNKDVKSSGVYDTATVKLRRDINKRVDIGIHAGYLHDWDTNGLDYVAGVSVGVSPTKNMWVELGYNFDGFTDEDFGNTDYTDQGAYINFRYKFNQDSIKDDLSNLRKKAKNDVAQ